MNDLGLQDAESRTQSNETREADPIIVGGRATCPKCGEDYSMADVHQHWQSITSNRAWTLAEKSGKQAPYAGYMIELKDGRQLRCRRDTHKTVFEVSA